MKTRYELNAQKNKVAKRALNNIKRHCRKVAVQAEEDIKQALEKLGQ